MKPSFCCSSDSGLALFIASSACISSSTSVSMSSSLLDWSLAFLSFFVACWVAEEEEDESSLLLRLMWAYVKWAGSAMGCSPLIEVPGIVFPGFAGRLVVTLAAVEIVERPALLPPAEPGVLAEQARPDSYKYHSISLI